MAFNVSAISAYTNETAQDLVKKAVLTGRTMELVSVVPGIKYKEALNILTNTPTIAAASCGFTPAGSVAFKQRDITVTALEVKEALCQKTLEQYWMGQLMKPGAPTDMELGPVLADSYVEKIKEANEMNIWQGIAGSTATSYNEFDGFLQILGAEVTAVGVTAAAAPHTSSDIVAHVDAMVAAVPEDILDRDDLILFMSYANYNLYTAALRTANLFHYNGAVGADYTCVIPGTNIKAVATKGLSGSGSFVLTYGANLVIGTDLLNEEEKFDIFYSRDNDEVRVNIQWKIGCQVYWPEFCVINF